MFYANREDSKNGHTVRKNRTGLCGATCNNIMNDAIGDGYVTRTDEANLT